MTTLSSKGNELEGILHIDNNFAGIDYLAARLSINLSSTLFGIKPATLLSFSIHKGRDLVKLWDMHKHDLSLGQNIEFFELKREHNNLVVLFYNRRNLTKQIFTGKHLRFLERFGYEPHMSLNEMLELLKERYVHSCPHEIGLFLGIPLKDVLGYLKLIPLECSYSGYWKVYGSFEKTKRLFESYRAVRKKVINLVCSGECPLRILAKPSVYRHFEEKSMQSVAV